jgi:hypothetical protein
LAETGTASRTTAITAARYLTGVLLCQQHNAELGGVRDV